MTSGVGTVLVVDDEPSLRLLCRVNLELEGFRVLEAGTLTQARTVIEEQRVDVVLLDVHVGDENGLELLDELRAAESPARVALLTGSADAVPGRFPSADLVLGKPFEPRELAAAIRSLILDEATSRQRDSSGT